MASYGMRRLISNDYGNTWRQNTSSPTYVPSITSPKSPKRIRNPLLPPSPRNGVRYLEPEQTQHQYNIQRQQSRHHSYNNDLNLFQTHKNNPQIARQRELLLQQRREQSQQLQSPSKQSYQNPFKSPTKQQPSKPKIPYISAKDLNDETDDFLRQSSQSDRSHVTRNKKQHLSIYPTNSTSHHTTTENDIPEHFINPMANRVSPAADRWRMRQKYDRWGKVSVLQDNLDTGYHTEQTKVIHTKKDQLRKELLEQMKISEMKRKREMEEKRAELDRMKKLTEMQKEMTMREQKLKIESQQKMRAELQKFADIQSKAARIRKQRELNDDRQFLEQTRIKEQAEQQKLYQKALKEQKRWSDMKIENDKFAKQKEFENEKIKQQDMRTMKLYGQILEKEERKRKQFLKDMQKEMGQRDEINYKILEQKQKELLEEEQRLLRYQQMRDQELLKKDIDYVQNKKHKENEYKSYLEQQMIEKQKAKQAEIERMRMERIELERMIKKQEEDKRDEIYNRKRNQNEYGQALRRQEQETHQHRVRDEYYMQDRERKYHKQYLEPKQTLSQDVIGAFPRESVSRRDRRYLQ